MTDFRAELQKLVTAYDEHGGRWPQHHEDALSDAVEQARRTLIQKEPEPEGPTDEDLEVLFNHLQDTVDGPDWHTVARAALARWGRPAAQPVQPVAVSDDAVFALTESLAMIAMTSAVESMRKSTGSDAGRQMLAEARQVVLEWLPANALPLPTTEA